MGGPAFRLSGGNFKLVFSSGGGGSDEAEPLVELTAAGLTPRAHKMQEAGPMMVTSRFHRSFSKKHLRQATEDTFRAPGNTNTLDVGSARRSKPVKESLYDMGLRGRLLDSEEAVIEHCLKEALCNKNKLCNDVVKAVAARDPDGDWSPAGPGDSPTTALSW